ncbi:hypothetical protein [Halosimplex salinum]|uniref:hypothetical protein n=1 Tax=Halosimplex salinum TaxID=1710538 RepID=UPI0019D280CD|nr:hypothetical protein [Halosimplex salinum]
MRRRAFLAAATAGLIGTAGCEEAVVRRAVSDPERGIERRREGAVRRYLDFRTDDETLVWIEMALLRGTAPFDFDVDLSHRDGTELTNLRLRFRTPTDESAEPVGVALEAPLAGDSPPTPSVSLYHSGEGAGTVVEVDEFGALADETVGLECLVTPRSETATTLAVDVTAEVDGPLGGAYSLDGRLEFEFPPADGPERTD